MRYRLYPARDQAAGLLRHCADARFVWNLGLEQRLMWRSGRPRTPGYMAQARQLTEARAASSWLAAGSVTVQQQALRDLDQAWEWFFAGTNRRPSWRRCGVHEGFRIVDRQAQRVEQINRRWSRVWVPKVGWVKFRRSRPVPKAKSYRVTRDRAGRWHVSFTAPQPPVERISSGRAVGLDRGISVSVTTSDGDMLSGPTPTATERARRTQLQRRLARQVKGSNRRGCTKQKLARLSTRQADRRKDWVEKTSTELMRQYDLIVLEDLKVRNMMRSARGTIDAPGPNVRAKAGLNRSIGEAGWSMLARRITDKAEASGVTVVKVNPRYTSQRCAACSHTGPENRESQAVFECRACGHQAHADVNAAINILAAGQAVSVRGGPAVGSPCEARTVNAA